MRLFERFLIEKFCLRERKNNIPIKIFRYLQLKDESAEYKTNKLVKKENQF